MRRNAPALGSALQKGPSSIDRELKILRPLSMRRTKSARYEPVKNLYAERVRQQIDLVGELACRFNALRHHRLRLIQERVRHLATVPARARDGLPRRRCPTAMPKNENLRYACDEPPILP
jgi:hypothetical protein